MLLTLSTTNEPATDLGFLDPDEAAARLPDGLRPHQTPVGTVVGCCMVDIAELRPWPLPAAVGIRQRAAAHRISVEWEDASGETIVGVWVPGRRTDAWLAVALGGRWFPGVHERARVERATRDDQLTWCVDDGRDFYIRVGASIPSETAEICDVVAGTCLSAAVGLSADHRGGIEAPRMQPDSRRAREVTIDQLDSRFIGGFRTAGPAPSYLMENIAVTWTPSTSPAGEVVRAA